MVFVFFFLFYGYHQDLHVLTHTSPTRRSSELGRGRPAGVGGRGTGGGRGDEDGERAARRARRQGGEDPRRPRREPRRRPGDPGVRVAGGAQDGAARTAGRGSLGRTAPVVRGARSEEHTSELQSLMRISYAV